MITQATLREQYNYDPETGSFTHRFGRCAGEEVGYLHTAGTMVYRRTSINYSHIYIHQLIWLYMTGSWPTNNVDHKDTDGLDNRWDNLREANKQGNSANRGLIRTNTSGFKGVSQRAGKFRAHIYVNGVSMALGTFETAEAAHEAYKTAALKYFGEFARAS